MIPRATCSASKTKIQELATFNAVARGLIRAVLSNKKFMHRHGLLPCVARPKSGGGGGRLVADIRWLCDGYLPAPPRVTCDE